MANLRRVQPFPAKCRQNRHAIKILTCLRIYLVQSQHMGMCNITLRVYSVVIAFHPESPDAHGIPIFSLCCRIIEQQHPILRILNSKPLFNLYRWISLKSRMDLSFIGPDVCNSTVRFRSFQKRRSAPKGQSNTHLATLVVHPTFYPLNVRRQHVKAKIRL